MIRRNTNIWILSKHAVHLCGTKQLRPCPQFQLTPVLFRWTAKINASSIICHGGWLLCDGVELRSIQIIGADKMRWLQDSKNPPIRAQDQLNPTSPITDWLLYLIVVDNGALGKHEVKMTSDHCISGHNLSFVPAPAQFKGKTLHIFSLTSSLTIASNGWINLFIINISRKHNHRHSLDHNCPHSLWHWSNCGWIEAFTGNVEQLDDLPMVIGWSSEMCGTMHDASRGDTASVWLNAMVGLHLRLSDNGSTSTSISRNIIFVSSPSSSCTYSVC